MWSARPEIVGRDAERAAGTRQLDAVRAGRGGVLLVEGPAGMGKTRVLDTWCADAADRGLRVVRATAVAGERNVPLALARRLASDPRSAPSAASDAVDDASSLAVRLRRLGDDGPTVVLIDDAQWADGASLRALTPLTASVATRPVCLILAARPSPAADAAGDALAELLDAGPQPVRLRLTALDRAATTTLVRRALADSTTTELAERCRHVTAGNPLLLQLLLSELVRTGRRDPDAVAVPDVDRFVGRELRRLPADARSLAAALAVLGGPSSPGTLGAVAGLDGPQVATAVEDLQTSGLVVGGGEPRFVHPLVAHAVLGAVPAPERAAAHRAAARALRARGAAVDVVAAHRLRTLPNDDPAVVEELRAGASRALSVGDPRTAEALLRRALDEPPPTAERPGVLHALAVAAVRSSGAAALDAFRVAGDQQTTAEGRADVALDHATALLELGRSSDALAVLDGVDQDEHPLPDGLRLRLEARRAVLAVDLRLAERVVPRLLQAAQAQRPTDAASRELLVFRGYVEVLQGRPAVAIETVEGALSPAEATGALPGLTLGLGVLVLAAGERFALADQLVEHHLTLARIRGDRARQGAARSVRGLLDLRGGRLAAAEAALRGAAHDVPEQNRLERTLLAGFLAHALILRGRFVDATATLRDHEDLVDASSAGQGLALAAASLALARGRTADGVAAVEAVQRAGLRASPVLATDQLLAYAYLRVGRRAEAQQAAARLAAEAELLPDARGALGVALTAQAIVGDHARREDRLRRAVELLRPSELRLELAAAVGHLGAHLRRQGRRVDARVLLHEARDLAQTCGAEPLRTVLEAELEASGATVGRRGTGVDGLTPSERRIAALAAQGRSNVEIAGELFLSRKTIEMHLTAVYRKLDIRSRGELADALTADVGAA